MNKDIVILTKSRKHGNYCVAGKDINTGEWIRLISEDESIHNAVRPSDLIYHNRKEANVLDVVNVDIKEIGEGSKTWYQPENYILNNRMYLIKLGEQDFNYLDGITDNVEDIFFNTSNYISKTNLEDVEEDTYSLILIEPDVVKIKRKNEHTLWANVKYNNTWYNSLTITDGYFTRKHYNNISSDNSGTNFYNIKLVISLGEEYNGNHYKLIASIIEPEPVEEVVF